MNGVSHMIPFITGGGILIALSYFLDRGNAGAEMFGRGTSLAMLVRTIGNTSFNLMYVVLAGFIAMSVGDLPALVAGMAGGMLAIQGTSLAPQAEWVSSGFWGAMIAGLCGRPCGKTAADGIQAAAIGIGAYQNSTAISGGQPGRGRLYDGIPRQCAAWTV